jgi:hypothetical protein
MYSTVQIRLLKYKKLFHSQEFAGAGFFHSRIGLALY